MSESEESCDDDWYWDGPSCDPGYVKDTRFVRGTFEVEFAGVLDLRGRELASIPVNIGGLGWSCAIGHDYNVDSDSVYLSVAISATGRKEFTNFECHANCEVVLKNRSKGPDVKWQCCETFAGASKCSFGKSDFIKLRHLETQEFLVDHSFVIQVSISPENVKSLGDKVQHPVENSSDNDDVETAHNQDDEGGIYCQPLISEVTRAILSHDHELLTSLIREDRDILVRTGDYILDRTDPYSHRYPLVEAIESGNLKCIEVILRNQTINLPNDTLPVFAAVRLLRRAFNTWDCLVKRGINMNASDDSNDNNTALHYACENGGSKDLIEFLLEHGCLLTTNRDNKLPHISTSTENHLNVEALNVLLELDLHAKLPHADIHYLDLAKILAKHDNLELLKVVFQRYREKILRSDANSEGVLLHDACKSGSRDLVQFLLLQGCSIRKRNGQLPHHVAAQYGNTVALKVLLKHDLLEKIIHETDDYSLLAIQIAKRGDLELLRMIYDHCKEQIVHRDSGDELLRVLIEKNDMEGFRYALRMGCRFPQGHSAQSCEIKSLNAAIMHEDPKYFALLFQFLSVDVVSKCTAYFEAGCKNSDFRRDLNRKHYPIIVAIHSKHVDRLGTLLSVGFSSNVPLFTTKSDMGGLMFRDSNLNQYSFERHIPHTVLSYTIFSFPWLEYGDMLQAVNVFLDYGAQFDGDTSTKPATLKDLAVNRKFTSAQHVVALQNQKTPPSTSSDHNLRRRRPFYKMPPVVAAVWGMHDPSYDPKSVASRVFISLIERGADFYYRAPDSIFVSPDCALIAAFYGNMTLVAHAVGAGREVDRGESQPPKHTSFSSNGACSSRTQQNDSSAIATKTSSGGTRKFSLDLFNDMLKFSYSQDSWSLESSFPPTLRFFVATSVNTALKFADGRDRSELNHACERLDYKFRFVRDRHQRWDRPALRFAHDSDTKWAIPNSLDNDDPGWEDVRRTLKTLNTLQHACRVVINRQLVRCDPRFTRSFENSVQQVPVPDILKTFLH